MMILLLAACPAEEPAIEEEDCLSTYAASEGYGYGTADTAAVEAECVAAGATGCDPSGWMTADAATCRAEEEGLAAGIAAWELSLYFDEEDAAARWNVSNTTYEDGYEAGGEALVFDAVTGSLIDELEWEQMP